MLNLLRRIDWPEEISPVGGVVSGKLIGQVFDYKSLMETAHENANKLEVELRTQMSREAELTRQQVAVSVKKDLFSLKAELLKHKQELTNRSMSVCTQISKATISNFLTNLSDDLKIKSMVEILLPKLYSTAEVIFTVHPDHVLTLENVLENCFNETLGKDEYKIVEDRTLERDLVRVKSYKDAFIEISIKNILAILMDEVDFLEIEMSSKIRSNAKNVSYQTDFSEVTALGGEEVKP